MADGFAPESAYASWTKAQRAAADRVEAASNIQRRGILAQADAAAGHPLMGQPDDSLRWLAKKYSRDLEDVESGDLAGGDKRARLLRAQLHDIAVTQEYRAALAESWLADEDGTHSYTAFQARGGLRAVLDNSAPAPSYDLAIFLDHEHFLRGLPTVMEWAA
jgi:hypothetical protein